MNLVETDLTRLAALAAARQDDFEVLRYQLQLDDEIDDSKLDAFVEALAAPIHEAIDCTQCANCCRGLDVYITPGEIPILAEGVGQSVESTIEHYVANPDGGIDMQLDAHPCKLLHGKRCAIYAHRPQACRDYPAFAPDFRWTLGDTIDGASICPIIYNVLCGVIDRIASAYPAISTEKQHG